MVVFSMVKGVKVYFYRRDQKSLVNFITTDTLIMPHLHCTPLCALYILLGDTDILTLYVHNFTKDIICNNSELHCENALSGHNAVSLIILVEI